MTNRRRICRALAVAAVVLAAGGGGCGRSKGPFTEPMKLGGKTVSAETLNEGYEAYVHFCYACHGEKGDGRGPSAPGMRPPPRDFGTGMFKFGGVAAGEMPNDEDLIALVKNGLAGTPMLPWDLSDRERHAVVQYIKTFSDRWKTEKPGDRIAPPSADPWVGKEAEAIELGKRLYHLSGIEKDAAGNPKTFFLSCNGCHPSYLKKKDLIELSQKLTGSVPEFRADLFLPVLKESGYMVGDYKVQILPVDFLFHRMKNGTNLESLYRTIASGIDGAAMPTWNGTIKPDDLWALVHYLRSLIDIRSTPQGDALSSSLGRGAI